jgi:riboflavin synthase
MFTGIVAAIGMIEAVLPLADTVGQADSGRRLVIEAARLGLDDVQVGDSIAIQGACMTVVQLGGPMSDQLGEGRFAVDISLESLSRTVGLAAPGRVNLEKALRLSDRLGGHLVSGHIDGLGRVAAFDPVGESWFLAIEVPAALAKYFAFKGSVTVDGVSLTVNRVEDSAAKGVTRIEINVIPHTMAVTTLGRLKVGDFVNIEVDQIARYCERLMASK